MTRTVKIAIFCAAVFITIAASALIPTPNNVSGGTAKMLFIIFGTVFFKAIFEWTWLKVFKK